VREEKNKKKAKEFVEWRNVSYKVPRLCPLAR
jgi:hypothetical protein